jgi:hypothetical protein
MSENLILFFHEDSPACKKLLSNIPPERQIQKVNINQVAQMPNGITSIPALVINNQKILQGKEVFDYLNANNELDSFTFSGKMGGATLFSSLGDDNVESNSVFSSIDSPGMNEGVPEWIETDEKKEIDLDRYQSERQQEFAIQPK